MPWSYLSPVRQTKLPLFSAPRQQVSILSLLTSHLFLSLSLSIYISYSDDCDGHHIPHHPEKPFRVTAILSSLLSAFPDPLYYRLAQAVTQEQLLLYHQPQQIQLFLKLCQRAEASGKQFQIDDDTEVSTGMELDLCWCNDGCECVSVFRNVMGSV